MYITVYSHVQSSYPGCLFLLWAHLMCSQVQVPFEEVIDLVPVCLFFLFAHLMCSRALSPYPVCLFLYPGSSWIRREAVRYFSGVLR